MRVLGLSSARFLFCFYEGRSIRDVIWTGGLSKRRKSPKCVSFFLSRIQDVPLVPLTQLTYGRRTSLRSSCSKCLLKDPPGASALFTPYLASRSDLPYATPFRRHVRQCPRRRRVLLSIQTDSV